MGLSCVRQESQLPWFLPGPDTRPQCSHQLCLFTASISAGSLWAQVWRQALLCQLLAFVGLFIAASAASSPASLLLCILMRVREELEIAPYEAEGSSLLFRLPLELAASSLT